MMNIEGLSLDHLRVFLAVAEEGSVSETARRFARAQSAVSHTISTLERQLGVELFARSNGRPTLTDTGTALLPHAVEVVSQADRLKSHANALSGGLEPELSIVVDCVYPISSLSLLLRDLHLAYPTVGVNVQVETLAPVAELVLSGNCSIGIVVTSHVIPPALQAYALEGIQTLPVASPDHPLARLDEPADDLTLSEHIQIVLTDRTELTKGRDFGVLSPNTWRVSDLGAKHELLRAGLGWGSMPLHLVADDLACNRLKALATDSLLSQGEVLPVKVVHRADAILGPVAQWSIQRLRSKQSRLRRS